MEEESPSWDVWYCTVVRDLMLTRPARDFDPNDPATTWPVIPLDVLQNIPHPEHIADMYTQVKQDALSQPEHTVGTFMEALLQIRAVEELRHEQEYLGHALMYSPATRQALEVLFMLRVTLQQHIDMGRQISNELILKHIEELDQRPM